MKVNTPPVSTPLQVPLKGWFGLVTLLLLRESGPKILFTFCMKNHLTYIKYVVNPEIYIYSFLYQHFSIKLFIVSFHCSVTV